MQKIFTKDFEVSFDMGQGHTGTIDCRIVITKEKYTEPVAGTHAVTHDDFIRNVPCHTVETFIKGKLSNTLTTQQWTNKTITDMVEMAERTCTQLVQSQYGIAIDPVETFIKKLGFD